MTLQLGVVSGSAQDSTTIGTAGTTEDSYDKTSASISYAVASGVTAILGYSNVDSSDEGTLMLQTVQLGTLVLTWHFNQII